MSRVERMVYEYGCDICGETEQDEVDDLPLDWTEDEDGNHRCERCA